MGLSMERMAQNEAAARRIGDERTADYWRECIEVASLHEQLRQWDVLKGSPEHDGRVNG
jgi:hypothetical protein